MIEETHYIVFHKMLGYFSLTRHFVLKSSNLKQVVLFMDLLVAETR